MYIIEEELNKFDTDSNYTIDYFDMQKVKVKILSISSTERHLGLSLKETSEVVGKKKMGEKELAEAVNAAIESEVK